MKQAMVKGYKVTIFFHYNGTQLFIENAKGETIYTHKVSYGKSERGNRTAVKAKGLDGVSVI